MKRCHKMNSDNVAFVCLQPDETVLQFTNRVKADIACQGGLVDLDWSVALRYTPPVCLSVCLSVCSDLLVCAAPKPV